MYEDARTYKPKMYNSTVCSMRPSWFCSRLFRSFLRTNIKTPLNIGPSSKFSALSYREQLHMHLKLHDKAPVVLNDFGVSCTEPANCQRGSQLQYVDYSHHSCLIMACQWATETEISTYPSPWHRTLQNLLLNEKTTLNFWVNPCCVHLSFSRECVTPVVSNYLQ